MKYSLEFACGIARQSGFYDFIDQRGGCNMVVVRDGKICGSIDAAFKARSDSKDIVPDFRDPRAVSIADSFMAELTKTSFEDLIAAAE